MTDRSCALELGSLPCCFSESRYPVTGALALHQPIVPAMLIRPQPMQHLLAKVIAPEARAVSLRARLSAPNAVPGLRRYEPPTFLNKLQRLSQI